MNTQTIYKIIPLIFCLFITSCATVSSPDERDPWESFNRSVYSFNDVFDKAIAVPVAEAYQFVLPDFVETGISNFFSNLNEVVVIINDLLQFKFYQAVSDFSRLVTNTTFGLFGFFDVASHMDLPQHDEDFGQTLATWGVGDGPYMMLPLLGPSTVRDTTGLVFDSFLLNPIGYIEDDEERWGLIALASVDKRASLLEATRLVEKSGIDPYVFIRNAYYQVRQNQIYDGNPPSTLKIKKSTAEDRLLEDELEQELLLP